MGLSNTEQKRNSGLISAGLMMLLVLATPLAYAQGPFCGDGNVDPGEQCDDGNNVDGDGCSSTCQSPRCGDAILDPGEQCDDGNNVDGDGCSSTCQAPRCGDAILDPGEQCDDGNNVDGDSCSSTCQNELPGSSNQIEGFAESAGVTGGAGGSSIIVTNLNSSGAGSLKAAVEATGTRIITFAPGLNGTINFDFNANAKSNMTLDGTGHNITISGFSLNMAGTGVRNIIVHNLTFADTSPGTGTNAVLIRSGAHDIWVDHNTFIRNNLNNGVGQGIAVYHQVGTCGALAGNGVTISWNHFAPTNKKALLIGADQDGCNAPHVTIHHNRFEGITSRSPRIHHPAIVHYYNNYCDNWGEYCLGSGDRPDVLVENNIFETGPQQFGAAVQARYANIASHSVNASGNLLLGSPTPVIETVGTFSRSLLNYSYNLQTANNTLKQNIVQCAGAGTNC